MDFVVFSFSVSFYAVGFQSLAAFLPHSGDRTTQVYDHYDAVSAIISSHLRCPCQMVGTHLATVGSARKKQPRRL